jgi:hypothetical protein
MEICDQGTMRGFLSTGIGVSLPQTLAQTPAPALVAGSPLEN